MTLLQTKAKDILANMRIVYGAFVVKAPFLTVTYPNSPSSFSACSSVRSWPE